jgi:hypothetical protein
MGLLFLLFFAFWCGAVVAGAGIFVETYRRKRFIPTTFRTGWPIRIPIEQVPEFPPNLAIPLSATTLHGKFHIPERGTCFFQRVPSTDRWNTSFLLAGTIRRQEAETTIVVRVGLASCCFMICWLAMPLTMAVIVLIAQPENTAIGVLAMSGFIAFGATLWGWCIRYERNCAIEVVREIIDALRTLSKSKQ